MEILIKQILDKLILNRNSHFHCKMLNSLDGPGENYCEVITKINSKVLEKDINYLNQDRLAKNMLLHENLIDVARKERKQCTD